MAEYPKTITIKLSLELQAVDSESEAYFLKDPPDEIPSTKFLADLFDIFEYEGSIGVERINEFTKSQIAKTLLASQLSSNQ